LVSSYQQSEVVKSANKFSLLISWLRFIISLSSRWNCWKTQWNGCRPSSRNYV